MGFEWIPRKNYKRHYICLACQKGFKRPSEKDLKFSESIDLSDLMPDYYASHSEEDLVQYITDAHHKLKPTCPNCEALLLEVDYTFEVPPLRDAAAWKMLRKRLSTKSILDVTVYTQWHRIEMEKVAANSAEYKQLQANLQKLEGLSAERLNLARPKRNRPNS